MANGWNLIVGTLKIFRKYPIFIVPIIVVWVVYAAVVIEFKYFFPWQNFGFQAILGIIFLTLFALSFIILLSCATVLEMIQQLETGKALDLPAAFGEVMTRDMLKILPIAIIWAIIWFILTIIEAMLSKKKDGKESFSAENAAKTLAGYGGFSFSRAFIQAIEKGIRMIIFLILPAIAWEDLGFVAAVKKGFGVLRVHLAEFATGYALTYAAAVIVFLPPAIIMELGTGRHGNPPLIHFPDSVWVGVIIYIGFAWSFCMYLEQMFTANLYLWHLKWEKAVAAAKAKSEPLPQFKDIKCPSLLDEIPDLC